MKLSTFTIVGVIASFSARFAYGDALDTIGETFNVSYSKSDYSSDHLLTLKASYDLIHSGDELLSNFASTSNQKYLGY